MLKYINKKKITCKCPYKLSRAKTTALARVVVNISYSEINSGTEAN